MAKNPTGMKQPATKARRLVKTTQNGRVQPKWTVMIYLVGDNDLSEESVWSLLEVFRAGTSDEIDVVVQIDPRAKGIKLFEVGRLLEELAKRRSRDNVHREILSVGRPLGGKESMASIDTLTTFVSKTKEHHTADNYLLILSGHAGGPVGKSFLIDQFPAGGLSLKDVSSAIEAAGGVDVLGMDSCGMGMVEVGQEFHKSGVEYLVASEGFELNTGWPYFEIIDWLKKNPLTTPRALADTIVKIHTGYYSNYLMSGVSTDMAACEIALVPKLTTAIKQLAQEMTRNLLLRQKYSHDKDSVRDDRVFVEDLPLAHRSITDAIILAHWRAQSYRFERHTDLYDFCDLLKRGCEDKGIQSACDDVMSVIKGKKRNGTNKRNSTNNGYVITSCHSGGAFQHSHGVAIYFPWAVVEDEYSELELSRKTGWDLFLRAYVRRTRRRAREESRNVQIIAGLAGNSIDIKDFPELGTKDFPELGTKDFPELSTKDFPELGTKDFPELGTRDFPELGTKGKLLVPVMKNPPDIFFSDPC